MQLGGSPRPVIEQETLDAMTDAMRHRGPSDRGTYLRDGIALGARRLSIVDVEGGHQPVSNEDGTVWTVHNGELFNHLELRRGLESSGHRLASHCDTEVIPHLYERDGDAFPERLRGMFGIALFDEPRRRLVLVRDRLGIKPLYYAQRGDLVVFASELKALLASGLVGGELDYDAIDAYLTLGYFPAPLTPLAGVHKLEPGHRLVVSDRVSVERYWAYPRPEPTEMTAAEASELLLASLEESVRLRLMSDVPLGAMLSGGLDSSLVVALMARNMSEPVKTFSVGFREDAANELADARLVAETFGTDHTELELSFSDDAVSLEDLVWHLDEPLADLSALGFDALCQLAVQDVTVALSGQGADELFGGYAKHRAAWAVGALDPIPRTVVRAVAGIAALGPEKARRASRAARANGAVERLLAMSGDMDDDRRKSLYRGPLAAVDGLSAARAVASRLDGVPDDPLPTTLFLDAQLALPDLMLHYFDRTSMAHSLEVRVPFLDHELVELCARIPPQHKLRRGSGKVVLRQAARGLVPDSIIDKPKVGFFANAVDEWMRTRLRTEIGARLTDADLRCAELLDTSTLRRLADDFVADRGSRPRGRLLLSVLMLEVWLDSFLDRAGRAPSAVVS